MFRELNVLYSIWGEEVNLWGLRDLKREVLKIYKFYKDGFVIIFNLWYFNS